MRLSLASKGSWRARVDALSSPHSLTKVLHFVKLRTACGGSGEKLLLQQTTNPLRKKVILEQPLPADFTDKFIASFSEPLNADT